MTVQEASERYNIPIKILNEYESWGLCDAVRKVMGAWQYDEEDIKRLSMIMRQILKYREAKHMMREEKRENLRKKRIL